MMITRLMTTGMRVVTVVVAVVITLLLMMTMLLLLMVSPFRPSLLLPGPFVGPAPRAAVVPVPQPAAGEDDTNENYRLERE